MDVVIYMQMTALQLGLHIKMQRLLDPRFSHNPERHSFLNLPSERKKHPLSRVSKRDRATLTLSLLAFLPGFWLLSSYTYALSLSSLITSYAVSLSELHVSTDRRARSCLWSKELSLGSKFLILSVWEILRKVVRHTSGYICEGVSEDDKSIRF